MIADWSAGMKPPAPPRPGLGPGLHTGAAGGLLARQGRVGLSGATPVLFDDAFSGPGGLIARSSGTLSGLEPEVRVSLRRHGIDLVAITGPPAGDVTVIEDVDATYIAGSTISTPTWSSSVPIFTFTALGALTGPMSSRWAS